MRATFSAVVISAVLLAGASGCGGAAGSATTLSWHDCNDLFRCATLSVPLSYSDPRGAQIPISVVELPAKGPHPIGDIVLNPGGPGESGVQFLEQEWHMFPASLRAKFNLVSFDPRGVGSSRPLQCLTPAGIRAHAALNPAPRTPKQIAVVIKATRDFVRGCEKNASPAFISSMSTANGARDMDRLRAALGQKRLTYAGFSYGTYLGTVYAELFPKRVRAMVLDGAVDASLDFDAAAAQQAAGFEADLQHFFAWCTKNASCRKGLSPSPARAYGALFAGFEKGRAVRAAFPLPKAHPPLVVARVNYGIALQGVLAALYSTTTWPILAQALAAAKDGDGALLAVLAYALSGMNPDGSFSNIVSANTATGCADPGAPTTLREHEALARRLSKSAPDFGRPVAWTGLACRYWPERGQTRSAPAHAPGAPPILVIGSTGDPATPYAWAKALASQLPRATLLTRRGNGHTGYRASNCIRRWANRYLRTLRMPPPGTVCASD